MRAEEHFARSPLSRTCSSGRMQSKSCDLSGVPPPNMSSKIFSVGVASALGVVRKEVKLENGMGKGSVYEK